MPACAVGRWRPFKTHGWLHEPAEKMTKADLLLALVRSSLSGDSVNVRRSVEAIAYDEGEIGHRAVAGKLRMLLEKFPSGPEKVDEPLENRATVSARTLDSLALTPAIRSQLEDYVFEYGHREYLEAAGLSARSRILITGPPGTGKTSVAHALGAELGLPVIVARYENLIGSFLGETSSHLARLLANAGSGPCVLFLDEFETLAKERSDPNDAGEMKRVVSTLLLQMDALPADVILVAATNHPELLDRAAWRRFELTVTMPLPTAEDRADWVRRRSGEIGLQEIQPVLDLVAVSDQMPYSRVEDAVVDARRREILAVHR